MFAISSHDTLEKKISTNTLILVNDKLGLAVFSHNCMCSERIFNNSISKYANFFMFLNLFISLSLLYHHRYYLTIIRRRRSKILVNIHRDKVEVNIFQCSQSEAKNCVSIIIRGEYQELKNNGPKHKNTDVIVRVHARMQP